MTNTNEGKSSTIERFPSFVKLFRTLLNSCKLKNFYLAYNQYNKNRNVKLFI